MRALLFVFLLVSELFAPSSKKNIDFVDQETTSKYTVQQSDRLTAGEHLKIASEVLIEQPLHMIKGIILFSLECYKHSPFLSSIILFTMGPTLVSGTFEDAVCFLNCIEKKYLNFA